jgi:hypothetical protein
VLDVGRCTLDELEPGREAPHVRFLNSVAVSRMELLALLMKSCVRCVQLWKVSLLHCSYVSSVFWILGFGFCTYAVNRIISRKPIAVVTLERKREAVKSIIMPRRTIGNIPRRRRIIQFLGIGRAVLDRCISLVDVEMTREHEIDVVLDENGFKGSSTGCANAP